ncbi:hypothetical protein NC652_031985 [Populus alba x Populus x berolinensis]|nr:hypothetical protein NC652_031985 [Populus alba x Populus x berolinensis]
MYTSLEQFQGEAGSILISLLNLFGPEVVLH